LIGWPLTTSAQDLRTSPIQSTSQIIRSGDILEVYVDESGKIYKELRYHGIIPSIRDRLGAPQPETDAKGKKKSATKRSKKAKSTQISWIGFQQKQFYSRVFIQTDRLSRFRTYFPDKKHIVVAFESAKIPRLNDRREIITNQFSTAIDRITSRQKGKSAEIVISLRKPAGYLYKQQGNYVFIDVER
jgi:hypothetical protein